MESEMNATTVAVQARSNHDKATCALANKLARFCYAALRDQAPFASERVHSKLNRQAYPMPA
jgi:hypothetical protein